MKNKRTATCWRRNCNRIRIMETEPIDGVYGLVCPQCKRSLRQHPFFGQWTEYDKGDVSKWRKWCSLTDGEKAKVYERYDFPVPYRLFQSEIPDYVSYLEGIEALMNC